MSGAATTLDLNETTTFALLRGLLLTMLPPGVEVIQAQNNRVPEPASQDFVLLTPVLRKRLETNTVSYFADDGSPLPDVAFTKQPTQFDVQLDIHGPGSADNVQIISTLFRDEYSTSYFDAGSAPIQALYASDPRQVSFVNGEQQWENRWIVELSLQINPTVTTPQDFADPPLTVVGIISVDVVYPP